MAAPPVLAIDVGGSKIAAALVLGAVVQDRRECATAREAGPEVWLADLARLVQGWSGYRVAGLAATGVIRDGLWRAVNAATLPVPDDFAILDALRRRLGVPVLARNDAQAAAWGEYRFGAAAGLGSVVFVTVSTGIGGGLVIDGRLVIGRAGLAGHLGITPIETDRGPRLLEDIASGSALARLAERHGGARDVSAAAAAGEPWAAAMMDTVVAPFALALRRLQLVLDPDAVVVGGGLGLAPGYLARLQQHLVPIPASLRPDLRAAALGADAGLIGIADLASTEAPEFHA